MARSLHLLASAPTVLARVKGAVASLGGFAALDPPYALSFRAIRSRGSAGGGMRLSGRSELCQSARNGGDVSVPLGMQSAQAPQVGSPEKMGALP